MADILGCLEERGIRLPADFVDGFAELPASTAAYVTLQAKVKRDPDDQLDEFKRILKRFETMDGLEVHVEGWYRCVRAIDTGDLSDIPRC